MDPFPSDFVRGKADYSRCQGLVPWYFTLVAKKKIKTKKPDATGLSSWSVTRHVYSYIAVEREPSTAQGRGIQAGFNLACNNKRDTPRDKPVASSGN
ncbi:MAG TPA: hypothetical protein VJT69_03555, partial [Pyrinomonadaceae bacterium]|nr:hypothetical protein [Pyrinomonadaceae bacterium]